MMTQLELAPFTQPEMNYIKEFCKVSEPVAIALDMLQGEAQAYFGTLLPTIVVAKQKLQDMISTCTVKFPFVTIKHVIISSKL
jgi:transcription termination factor NusB